MPLPLLTHHLIKFKKSDTNQVEREETVFLSIVKARNILIGLKRSCELIMIRKKVSKKIEL